MKTLSVATQAVLASRQFYMADLYTLTLSAIGGTVLRYASVDRDITVGGNTFRSGATLFQRTQIAQTRGIEVDTLSITCFPLPTDTILGVPFLQAMRLGYFDAADVQLERLFTTSWTDTSPGTVIVFVGRVADVTAAGRSSIALNVKSHLEILDVMMPRNVYQAPCVNTLFDHACGVVKASYANTGTLVSVTGNLLQTTVTSQASGYFSQGQIKFTSGVNINQSRPVRVDSGAGMITLTVPFLQAPSPGDALTLFPGCDKTFGVGGCGKFANTARYGGQPYIPIPETAA